MFRRMEKSIPLAQRAKKPLIKEGNSERLLRLSGKIWFIITVMGQWLFAAYVAIFYGGTAMMGNSSAWNDALPTGIEKGDPVGNFALAGHLLLAVFITIGGPSSVHSLDKKKGTSLSSVERKSVHGNCAANQCFWNVYASDQRHVRRARDASRTWIQCVSDSGICHSCLAFRNARKIPAAWALCNALVPCGKRSLVFSCRTDAMGGH